MSNHEVGIDTSVTSDDPQARPVLLLGGVAVLVLVVTVIALQALFLSVKRSEEQSKVFAVPDSAVIKLQSQQLATLESYGWVDRDKGLVRIPVSRAMDLMVKDIATQPAAAATAAPGGAHPTP